MNYGPKVLQGMAAVAIAGFSTLLVSPLQAAVSSTLIRCRGKQRRGLWPPDWQGCQCSSVHTMLSDSFHSESSNLVKPSLVAEARTGR